jgi:hypothetical protein
MQRAKEFVLNWSQLEVSTTDIASDGSIGLRGFFLSAGLLTPFGDYCGAFGLSN